VGVQYSHQDIEAQLNIKDVFDPKWLLNGAKVFPLISTENRRAA
jgi:glycolate oxidase